MRFIRILFCLFLLGNLFFPKNVFAAENFSTAYDVTYTISETGLTNVQLKIGLTNKTTEFYASSYKVEVGFENIANLVVSDPRGTIVPDVKKTVNGNSIFLKFNSHVVGKGNTLPFTISFDTPNVAQKHGTIWEVNIPGFLNQIDVDTFLVHVVPPDSFGAPSYIKPQVLTSDLTFTKEQLGKSGISLAFGDHQTYSYNLVYHLQNKNLFPSTMDITLPPSTNYQDVYIEKISPKPNQVVSDSDGNWIASYSLYPHQEMDIILTGKVAVSYLPKKFHETPEQLKKYVMPETYWEITDPKITALAKKLQTPENIYNFVVTHLTYDFDRVTSNSPRLGALASLNSPNSAVCMEFTDLFIALARAAGIPSREVDGFAYTENARQRPLSLVKDILHAWPEYYDVKKEMWIMIDPTWGNTTKGVDYFHILDFDHVAFVKRGVKSDAPIPAGGYKYIGEGNKKDVNVNYATSIAPELREQQIALTPDSNHVFLSGHVIKQVVNIKNLGRGAIYPEKMNVTTGYFLPHATTITTPLIPPFGNVDVSYALERTGLLTNKIDTITIHLGTESIPEQIRVVPFLWDRWTGRGGIILALFSYGLFIIARKTWRLYFQRRKR